eukprot:TRINITY_DN1726_c0_g1_i1.p2 TRINITY_DN1726_c0_g1~~TRINITY_DN1726_c0_g1_i1.p2  ORF type:complete len:140 (+),score=41.62 TRINITY_DN1726_c0_g1_i1:244-663(+)
MEVAAALLDASRKLSHNNVSNSDVSNSSGSSWNSSTNELTDKTGDLPNSNSWLGGWGNRARALSESSSTPDKLDTVAWLGGWAIPKKNNSTTNTPNNTPNMTSGFLIPERHRIRRSSSKDVEEAMAGGLGKADMYMPPM